MVFPKDDVENDYEIKNEYKKYLTDYILSDEIEDAKKNIIIFSETYGLEYYRKFKHIQKAVWFLSIGGYRAFYDDSFSFYKKIKRILRITKHRVFSFFDLDFYVKNDKTVNLAASYYAFDYLKKHKGEPKLFIEPISMEFIQYFNKMNFMIDTSVDRKNIVLYNPVKGDNTIMATKLQSLFPEYEFVPLKGYSHQEMKNLMISSKLYIDFGTFPGAERIPKEAAICGMCILTSRNGAADYHGDVPIPDNYKFGNYLNETDQIKKAIIHIMNNYESAVNDFEEYRKTVYNLENNFLNQISEIFKK